VKKMKRELAKSLKFYFNKSSDFLNTFGKLVDPEWNGIILSIV